MQTEEAWKLLRIAVLNEEMDTIHCANSLYWNAGQSHPLAARVEYQFRKKRLDNIRIELTHLRWLLRTVGMVPWTSGRCGDC
jgi:hypothetical protein